MFQTTKIAAFAIVATIGIMATAQQASAFDRRVLLINNSHETIREFHASNVSRSDFEEDILGDRVIPPGGQMVINIDDRSGYCRYDFLAVFNSGQRLVKSGVDVCTVQRVIVS